MPVRIKPLTFDDVAELTDVRLRNRAFLTPWEPLRDEIFWTRPGQEADVAAALRERDEGRAFPFVIVEDGRLVGRVNLSGIVRGVFQNAYLGYWVDEDAGGRGVATEAVRQTVAFAFGEGGLHRVQAAVMPRNAASIRVLEKAGFREEGLARQYLRVAGAWEDHKLYAVTKEDA